MRVARMRLLSWCGSCDTGKANGAVDFDTRPTRHDVRILWRDAHPGNNGYDNGVFGKWEGDDGTFLFYPD